MESLEEKFRNAHHDNDNVADTIDQCVEIAEEYIRFKLCDFYEWLAINNRLQYNGVPTKMNMVDVFLQYLKTKNNVDKNN